MRLNGKAKVRTYSLSAWEQSLRDRAACANQAVRDSQPRTSMHAKSYM